MSVYARVGEIDVDIYTYEQSNKKKTQKPDQKISCYKIRKERRQLTAWRQSPLVDSLPSLSHHDGVLKV